MPVENSYTIGELAQGADVTVRTIRYYVAQGLLPPPEGGGRAATYTPHHLARLNLVKILKDEFLPLHEIRALLSGLDDGAVADLLREKQAQPAPPPPAPNSAKAYLQTLLNPPTSPAQPLSLMRHKVKARQLREESLDQESARAGDAAGQTPAAPAPAGQGRVSGVLPARNDPPPTSKLPASTRPGGAPFPLPGPHSTPAERWQRYQITPNIELHIKEGTENHTLWQKVEQVIKIARQILNSVVIG